MIDINSLVRKNIQELTPYASAREQFLGKASIYLDANENPFANGLNRYPDPEQKDLKRLISKRNMVAPSQIVLGNGSDELLDLIMRVFCEPAKDNIIITPPTFGIYKVLANANNVEAREAPLTNGFELDTTAMLDLVDNKTKVIYICSPNNPTGNLMDINSIKKLLALNCIIVIDEAYIDFTEQKSWTNTLPTNPNLIILQTFSKAWAMAGIRIGMSFSSPEIAQNINKIRLPYNVNSLSQQKAIEAFENTSIIDENLQAIKNEKRHLWQSLSSLSMVDKIYPSDANFFLVRFKKAKEIYTQLAHKGIVVRDFSSIKGCEECLRISVGTPAENKTLIETLQIIN